MLACNHFKSINTLESVGCERSAETLIADINEGESVINSRSKEQMFDAKWTGMRTCQETWCQICAMAGLGCPLNTDVWEKR